MGVSFRSYGKLGRAVPEAELPEGDALWDSDLLHAFVLEGFAEHALEGLEEGRWYEYSSPGPVASFSYGGYNWFREELCGALGVPVNKIWEEPKKFRGSPYYDLLNFADNEGLLGPAACTRIANSFRHHPVVFEEDLLGGRYEALREVFYHAADGGAVNLT